MIFVLHSRVFGLGWGVLSFLAKAGLGGSPSCFAWLHRSFSAVLGGLLYGVHVRPPQPPGAQCTPGGCGGRVGRACNTSTKRERCDCSSHIESHSYTVGVYSL